MTITAKLLRISIVLLLPITAAAKDYRLAEVFAGYSLAHGDLQHKAGGWEFSIGKNLNQWFSLHADFDAHHQSDSRSQRHQHDFLFGAQFSHRINSFTMFAHGLTGVCNSTGNLGTQTGFAVVTGGGLDWDFSPVLAVRVAQLDYHTANLFGGPQHQARFSAGLVFHLIGWGDPARPAPPPPPQNPT